MKKKPMNLQKKYAFPFLAIAVASVVASCSSNRTPTVNNNISEVPTPTATATPEVVVTPTPTLTATPTPTPTETNSLKAAKQAPSTVTNLTPTPNNPKPKEATPPKNAISYNAIPSATQTPVGKTIDVTVYSSDAQCQELVPQKTAIPAEEPVAGVVGKILEGRDSGDFSLSGYRVNVKDGVATVDFRLNPNSKRFLTSLSSCEQFALFGSLRKTLTSNNQWKIKDVRFTEKGEEVAL
jgi:Sporulation and spore germination